VGRFLEHSRVMSFCNGGDPEFWLGSADLMHRNLDRRVEVLMRVCQDAARHQLQSILDAAMGDDVDCWVLAGDATWTRTGTVDHQGELMARAGEHAG
jgi:polyphosphate kinase